MIRLSLITLFLFLSSLSSFSYAQDKGTRAWRAGTARVNITPQQPMWLAGFGSRTKPSEGKIHDLWAKALIMEDAKGRRAVLITMDLNGIPRNISIRIRERLETKYSLSRSRIILNASHTHSGPVLDNYLYDVYPITDELKERSRVYTIKFEEQIVNLVGSAIRDLEPVKVYSENGVTRFQVNRRNNSEAALSRQTELEGPNDYAVPVIKVVNRKNKLKAIAFGYSCHPSVLSLDKWSGDYPGFAQIELEKLHPGATALFFQSTGADQNAIPRNTIAWAKQYGTELAAAVGRVMEDDMKELSPELATAYREIDLPFAAPYTIEELERMKKDPSKYQQAWAARMLEKARRGESLPKSYPYPIQVWKLGEQPIMAMGGEVVVQYGIDLKKIFGQQLFVMGYSNDIMTYIPSERILKEGKYEGFLANILFGLPGQWAAGVQSTIVNGMVKLAEEAGVEEQAP
ncbi:neutral/alkaline non-lysosomal ceramidase N-terminal domain-containing protein [Daejeonella sp. JGW-45]|uniref:neutral/alkaline non-lysosomal ceramidase N-terminal domain-containing protein n=1 Tax=Daejeonella sp. JGW-45 TaxID=3034148 RepID=UPI0023EA82F5|nr:neutral/alkaline non-lysosomal ceramidase N-terminal domain-containing protein [Daejeonella sp. JGW-45]